jgi:hypothetical protein
MAQRHVRRAEDGKSVRSTTSLVFRYTCSLILAASCKRYDLAEKYFPNAAAWIPLPFCNDHGIFSEEFEYKSIMIYSSTDTTYNDIQPRKYAITTKRGDLIYQGGDPDPELAGLSKMDIERVAALYPIENAEPQSAQETPPTKRSSDANSDAQIAKRWFSIPADQKIELLGGRRL